MTRLRRSSGTALALSALAVTGFAGVAAPAAVADDCPNAAVRSQQGVQHLPNCYAYEKVTGPDKYGALIEADSPMAPDGSAVSTRVTTAIADDDTNGHSQLGAAFRGADGWTVESLTDSPRWGTIGLSGVVQYPYWQFASPDLRTLLYLSHHPLFQGETPGVADLFIGRAGTSDVTWVTRPATLPQPSAAGTEPTTVAMSPDAARVAYQTSRMQNAALDNATREHVWLYQEGQDPEIIDRLPNGIVSTGTVRYSTAFTSFERRRAAVAHASVDVRTVAFRSTSENAVAQIYARKNVGTSSATTIHVSRSTSGAACTVTPTFLSLTEDGRYLRFSCGQSLTPGAPASGGAYVRDLQTDTLTFDEPAVDYGTVRLHPSLVGEFQHPGGRYGVRGLGGALYRTDRVTNTEVCVSCRPGTTSGSGGGGGVSGHAQGGADGSLRNLVTADGDVIFNSPEAYVPEDTNNAIDVYLWRDGKHYLLTSGRTRAGDVMGGVSDEAVTVSFSTTASLVPEDRDGGERDIYVLRKNGGFFRAAPPAECTSGCQGPAAPVASLLTPLSVSFPAAGDLVDESVDPVAVSGSRSVRGTSLKVKVRTPGAGRVTASGNGLRQASTTVKSAREVSVTVRLSTRSQRLLRTRSSLRRTATIRFVPAEGKAQSKRVNLTFRRAKKASKKKGTSRRVATAPSGKAAR